MKKKIVAGLALASLFASMPLNVMAKGIATVDFTGSDVVNEGENFKVYLNVKNIKNTYDGVVSLGGKLKYDETKLKFVDFRSVSSNYEFYVNPDAMMLAGLDFTLDNGIYNDSSVLEITFEAIEKGSAYITLEQAKLSDSQDYIDSKVNTKTINIIDNSTENDLNVISELVKEEKETNHKVETLKKEISKVNNYVKNIFKKITSIF